jgi:hypothetical protein
VRRELWAAWKNGTKEPRKNGMEAHRCCAFEERDILILDEEMRVSGSVQW